VEGGINLKKQYGERALSVFIMPPSLDTLKERLIRRGTDTERKIEMRLNKAQEEIARANEFDRIVVNDDLDKAYKEILILIERFLDNNK